MKQLFSHLTVHPQIIAVPCVLIPTHLLLFGYIAEEEFLGAKAVMPKFSGRHRVNFSASELDRGTSKKSQGKQFAGAKPRSLAKLCSLIAHPLPPVPQVTKTRLLVRARLTQPWLCCHDAASIRRLEKEGSREKQQWQSSGSPLGKHRKGVTFQRKGRGRSPSSSFKTQTQELSKTNGVGDMKSTTKSFIHLSHLEAF